MGAGIYADDRADSSVSDERAAFPIGRAVKLRAFPMGLSMSSFGGWADAESVWPNHEKLFRTSAPAWRVRQ